MGRRNNVYALEEHASEIIYNDLLEHFMIFIQNLKNAEGRWRQHLQLAVALQKTVHLFYMPEIHNLLVPLLLEFLIEGNA
jgi:cell division protein FtsX